jgi:hypothetical protein
MVRFGKHASSCDASLTFKLYSRQRYLIHPFTSISPSAQILLRLLPLLTSSLSLTVLPPSTLYLLHHFKSFLLCLYDFTTSKVKYVNKLNTVSTASTI